MRLMFQGCPPGNDVRIIQNRLNQASLRHVKQVSAVPPLSPDGIFGPKTGERVVEFQAKNGLVVDGIVGRQTEGTLNVLLGSPTKLTPEHVPPSQKKAASDGANAKTQAKMGVGSGQKTGAKSPGSLLTQKKTGAKMGGSLGFGSPPVPGGIPGAVFPPNA